MNTDKPHNQHTAALIAHAQAVIYTRLAAVSQDGSGSAINNQREACERFAQLHQLRVVESFADLGASGTNTERTGLQNMLSFVEANPHVRYIVVEHHYRLCRSAAEGSRIEQELRAKGVELLAVNANGTDFAAVAMQAASRKRASRTNPKNTAV